MGLEMGSEGLHWASGVSIEGSVEISHKCTPRLKPSCPMHQLRGAELVQVWPNSLLECDEVCGADNSLPGDSEAPGVHA